MSDHCKIIEDIADFHAHVLPGADHGSYSVTESVKQLALAAEYGVKRIVATPHFYPNAHTVEAFLSRRALACEMLAPALFDGAPSLALGAEVLLCNNIDKMPGLENLFIEGTSTLLLEMPYDDFSSDYVKSVERLTRSGVNVVLAHADRYELDKVNSMIDVGAKVQLNASSLCSFFKRRRLRSLLDRGAVVALGSDIHNVDNDAYKNFCKAQGVIKNYLSDIKQESDKLLEIAFLKK